MTRFYFDLHNGIGELRDEEGQELADAGAARERAIAVARELMGAEIQAGELNLWARIVIRDEGGGSVDAVRFSQAVTINP